MATFGNALSDEISKRGFDIGKLIIPWIMRYIIDAFIISERTGGPDIRRGWMIGKGTSRRLGKAW